MKVPKILIVAATSAIAEATARCYAARGAHLYLLARDPARAQAIADDLKIRGAASTYADTLDVTAYATHAGTLDRAWKALEDIDVILIAHGTLPDQEKCEIDAAYSRQAFEVNASATITLASQLAQRLAEQGHGTLAVISSVAGDRGRASNYLYGSAKAAVTTYFSGLRQRLRARGVNVLTVKPGFVDTPMTASFKKGALWANPEAVARGIVRAIDKRRSVVYLPWFWYPIMLVIRCVPEFLFRRIRL